jgi:hypothetical protein
MAGPLKHTHLLIELACAQDYVEQYADIDLEEEIDDTPLQTMPFSEESYEDLEGCNKLPTIKADVQQFVGEQNELLLIPFDVRCCSCIQKWRRCNVGRKREKACVD